MSHPNYARGYRHEKKCQAWLVHLGKCVRSFMSRGSDLTLTRNLREWSFSCKQRKPGKALSVNALKKECETHDFVLVGEDRDIPFIFGPLPKLIELIGQTEPQAIDTEALSTARHEGEHVGSERNYFNGTPRRGDGE